MACAAKMRRAGADGAGEQQRPVKPFADFADQCERALRTSVAASACGDRDEAVRALLNGLFGKLVVDDVMQRNPATIMCRLVDFDLRAPSEVIQTGTLCLWARVQCHVRAACLTGAQSD